MEDCIISIVVSVGKNRVFQQPASGEFKRFCLKESTDRLPFWRNYVIFTDNNIARMMEVQFVSDLVMNLEEGLQDFSATKLDNYYKRYDEGFPNADTIKDRLGKIYSIILEQKQDVFKGSIFCIPQVLFSLMLVLDRMKHANRRKLEYCITDIDSRVHAVRTGDNQKAIAADVYEAFSSGNMHRIRFRSKRDSVIEEYLS